MANPVLLHLPLRNNLNGRDRNGIVTATAFGPVRFTADGYYAEEGTTNLILNPGFEVSAANTLVANGATITRVTTDPYSGSACGQVVTPGVVNNEGIQWPTGNSIGIAAGQPMIAHARVKAPLGAKMQYWLRLTLDDASVTDTVITTFTGTGSWQPVVTPSLVVPSGRTVNIAYLMVRTDSVSVGAAPQAITFLVDDGQIEAKAYATSFCMGSMGAGYSWAGTAHASASTRAAAYLTLPSASALGINPTSGAIAVRGKRILVTGAETRYASPVGLGKTEVGQDSFFLFFLPETDSPSYRKLYAQWNVNGGAAVYTTKADAIDVGVVEQIYTGWSGTTTAIAELGDAAVVAGTKPVAIGSFNGSGDDVIIGGAAVSTSWGGSISDLLIFDRPLTDAERATLAATPEWSFGVLQPKLGNVLRVGMGVGVA